ncbi:hypothetical protein SB912_23740, partial [Pantoea sp. SIMBA_072]
CRAHRHGVDHRGPAPMKQMILAGLCLSLGACMMVGPDYEVPQDAAVQRSDLNGPLRQDADSVVSAPVPEDWWQLYQDQRLNELVRQALSANTELRVAAAQHLQQAFPGHAVTPVSAEHVRSSLDL